MFYNRLDPISFLFSIFTSHRVDDDESSSRPFQFLSNDTPSFFMNHDPAKFKYYYVGQQRYTHRCSRGGKWAKPDKVQVKCIYDKDAIDALQLNVTRLQSEVAYLQAQSNVVLGTELNVTRLQSEVLHLQAQSIIDAERIFHCKLPKNVYVGT